MQTYGLSRGELKFFKSLNTPEKIQDYIDRNLKYNFCGKGYPLPYVCKSPKRVLEERTAHCFEGALFAAAAMRINGVKPILIELNGLENDMHFIVPFKKKGLIGAMAQSLYYTLKWRDPIHRSHRELALSYFPFYVIGDKITMRTYSKPINLEKYDRFNWISTNDSLEELGNSIGKPKTPLFRRVRIRKVPEELDNLIKQSQI